MQGRTQRSGGGFLHLVAASTAVILLTLFSVSLLRRPAAAQVLHHREISVLGNSTQLLVVTTPAWNAQTGVLHRYERSRPGVAWRIVGHPIGVVLGQNGLGWEADATEANPGSARSSGDPVKTQGDLRSPAGIFDLGTAFGYAAQEPATWRMPYLRLSKSTECVDDPQSKFYNQIVDSSAVPSDWKSSEQMLRADNLNRWGLVVEQNVDPVHRGDGSCIFLHVWTAPGKSTAGGTASAKEQIKMLLSWLDPRREPRLVQLPVSKYIALKKAWALPAIPSSHPEN